MMAAGCDKQIACVTAQTSRHVAELQAARFNPARRRRLVTAMVQAREAAESHAPAISLDNSLQRGSLPLGTRISFTP
jgi:hypothetical protein